MARPLVTLAAAALSIVVLAGCAEAENTVSEDEAIVGRIADGDSIVLKGGARVRLLQIDAPELGEGECYGRESLRDLERMLQPGDPIVLESDPRLDRVDRYRRLLRYVLSASTNVNVELVRRGAATPYFRGDKRGRHAEALLDAVYDARDEGRGMWSACRVSWEPRRQVETRRR
ncbi:MAG: thermonuclease family protein [Actinomycetota bacterium]|nr:thermonuclease family protein [Actinomycetota bacterium]